MRQRWKKRRGWKKEDRGGGGRGEGIEVLNNCPKGEDMERGKRFVKGVNHPFYLRISNKFNKHQGHISIMITKLQKLKIECR